MPKDNLSFDELKELREEVLNAASKEEKKQAKLIFDGRQYSIRFPKKFIDETSIDLEKDFFEIILQIPEYSSGEKPSLSVKLVRSDSNEN